MTELTIDMVEDLITPGKEKDAKRASKRDKPASPSGRDSTGSNASSGRGGVGCAPSTNPLMRLLSQSAAKRTGESDGKAKPQTLSAGTRNDDAADGKAPCEDVEAGERRKRRSGIEHGPRTCTEDGECSSWTRIADEEFIRCLEECPAFRFHCAEDGAWETTSPIYCKSSLIRCTAEGEGAMRVEIDTGLRVHPGRIREANLFAMMANSILILHGFSRIGADGAVRFSYAASCGDPESFGRNLEKALACCEESVRPFSLVSQGTSPKRAFAIFSGRHDELDDFEFETAFDDVAEPGSDEDEDN